MRKSALLLAVAASAILAGAASAQDAPFNQVNLGTGTSTPPAFSSLSGDCTMSSTTLGVITCATTNGYTPANGATFVAASDLGVSTANADNYSYFKQADTNGQVVVLQPGIYNVGHTIAFTHSQTGIVCASNGGFAANTNGTPLQYPGNGCWLKWTGAPGGTMMTIAAPIGSTSDGRLKGNIVKGIQFDGNGGLAANGLLNYSIVYGTFDTLTFWNFSGGKAFSLDSVAVNALSNPTNFGDPGASQYNTVRNVFVGPFNNEIGLYTFYASFDTIQNFVTEENGGADGMQIVGSDNLHMFNIVNFQNGSLGSSSAYGLHFMTANLLGQSFPSNSNTVWGYSGSGFHSIHADGQTSLPGCIPWYSGNIAFGGCTGENTIFQLDKANAVPDPFVEPGAQLIWSNNDGTKGGAQMSSGLAVGDSYANQVAAAAAMTTEGLHIRNNNTNHIVLDNSAGATAWDVKIDSSGGSNANLIIQSQGTGQVELNAMSLNTIASGSGNAPTTTGGSCTGVGTVTGGGVAGAFQTTAACSGIIRLTFPVSAPHGWVCNAQDVTNTGPGLRQIGYAPTYCNLQVLNAAMGSGDTIVYTATAF